MTKHKMVCSNCGSEDVLRDAWAEWDVEKQDWVLQNVFDNAYCQTEDGECSITMVEIEEPEIGPVPIVTASGVHPENLDKIIEEQRQYYQPSDKERELPYSRGTED